MTDHRSMGALSRNPLPSLQAQVHNANFPKESRGQIFGIDKLASGEECRTSINK